MLHYIIIFFVILNGVKNLLASFLEKWGEILRFTQDDKESINQII